jgi:hypothetical protein
MEASLVEGTRSDLVFDGDHRPFVVEIVVHHEIDQKTVQRYSVADVPCFIVRPTWQTVGGLHCELISNEALLSRSEKCPTCRKRIQAEGGHQRLLQRLERRINEWVTVDERIARRRLRDWPPTVDRFGRPLYEGVRRAVADQAVQLLRVGFRQAKANRWLFVMRIDEIGTVLARIGGTEDEPLWINPRPSIKFRFRGPGSTLDYSTVIGRLLEEHGIVVDEYLEWSEKDGENGYHPPPRIEGGP